MAAPPIPYDSLPRAFRTDLIRFPIPSERGGSTLGPAPWFRAMGYAEAPLALGLIPIVGSFIGVLYWIARASPPFTASPGCRSAWPS